MRHKRTWLFALAAAGALLTILGVGVLIWAWGYPDAFVTERGANVTPDDLMQAQRIYHLGTIGGTVAAMLGIGIAFLAFKLLSRDLDRMRWKIGVSRK